MNKKIVLLVLTAALSIAMCTITFASDGIGPGGPRGILDTTLVNE